MPIRILAKEEVGQPLNVSEGPIPVPPIPNPAVRKGATATFGVPLAEVGINVSKVVVRYFPEVDYTFTGPTGLTLVRAVSQYLSRTVEVEGEVLSDTGLMRLTVALSLNTNFKNKVNDFEPVGGNFYLDEATVTASRQGWVSVHIKATAKPTL